MQPAHANYRSPGATFEPSLKKNDALKKFNGSLNDFQMWRERVIDHLCRTNRYWRTLLETLQVYAVPITKEWLLTQSQGGHSGWELSMMLEQFLVEWLGDSLYRRRKQLCGGVPGNGFEMWRWLYQEFQGGSEAVMLGGSRRLQDFPAMQQT